MDDLNLVYYGSKFYWLSGTVMSSLYTEDLKRSDWGKVEAALAAGANVHIRPATPDEIKVAEEQLQQIRKTR